MTASAKGHNYNNSVLALRILKQFFRMAECNMKIKASVSTKFKQVLSYPDM